METLEIVRLMWVFGVAVFMFVVGAHLDRKSSEERVIKIERYGMNENTFAVWTDLSLSEVARVYGIFHASYHESDGYILIKIDKRLEINQVLRELKKLAIQNK